MGNFDAFMKCIKYIFLVVLIHNLLALGIGFSSSTILKLPYKDRTVKLLDAPDFTDLDNPSVKFVKMRTSEKYGTSTIDYICISFDGTTDDIPYRQLPLPSYNGEEQTYTFNFTDEEKQALENALNGKDEQVDETI